MREASAPPPTSYGTFAEIAPVPHVGPALDPPVPAWSPALNKDAKLTLAMDGDGVRAISSILLVESLVNAICVRLDQRLDPYEIFDMIGGVSTMGLFAAMIGRMRMTAMEAREAYGGIARALFIDKWKFFISHDPHVTVPEINEPTLEDKVNEMVLKQCGSLTEPFFDDRKGAANVYVPLLYLQQAILINR
jgi:calcium-independent phospholipase A2-gamma